jgi:hypothetical protein
MHPLVRLRKNRRLVRDTHARQAGVGDERVEAAVAVVVDAQPDHVPAGMVGVAYAKDRECSLTDG